MKQIKLLPSRQVCIALAVALPLSLSMALAQERAKPGDMPGTVVVRGDEV